MTTHFDQKYKDLIENCTVETKDTELGALAVCFVTGCCVIAQAIDDHGKAGLQQVNTAADALLKIVEDQNKPEFPTEDDDDGG